MIRNDPQSRTIDAMRLMLTLCVVLVHAYTSTRADIDTGQYPVYRFVSFFFSLNLAQIAIPGFFFISGYLYFHTHRSFGERMRHEWHRLVVPYLFWNTLMLALYWGLEHISALSGFLSGDNLPIRQYTVTDYLRAYWDSGHSNDGNGTPILHQFWYIRNLLILGIISPVIRYYVRWTGVAGVVALIAWWIFTPGQGMIAKSFAFFTLGAWFSLNDKDFLPLFQRYARPIGALFLTAVVLITYFWNHIWAEWLNRLNDVVGLMFFTCLTAWMLSRQKHTRPLAHLQGLTFFIYATHDPLIILVKRLLLRITVPVTDLTLTLDYFLSTFIVIALCTAGYSLVKWLCPSLMSLMVGARSNKKTPAL